ncbi:hypothetical protein [Streptomyces sp. N35]|uniref:hypothetical protein n=1 Tax=Streptomyces sp. N35 TaxID=2795730 RepID=UPI0018F6FD8E|nr:hypothetical protein [Streptomyces sp. N35]
MPWDVLASFRVAGLGVVGCRIVVLGGISRCGGPGRQPWSCWPDQLADIVRTAIEERFDMSVYRQTLEQEEAERTELLRALEQ